MDIYANMLLKILKGTLPDTEDVEIMEVGLYCLYQLELNRLLYLIYG